ncbi:MAG: hypothetical protein JWQ38_2938 [Flavipsychrobacter sp.]|nr:hypothetical protein [Flavipsychrobacter sp.]
MTNEQAEQLMEKVSGTVLDVIKDMTGKQQTRKPICLDSIALVLRIKLHELRPVIDHLHANGDITIHHNMSKGTRTVKPDSISLN